MKRLTSVTSELAPAAILWRHHFCAARLAFSFPLLTPWLSQPFYGPKWTCEQTFIYYPSSLAISWTVVWAWRHRSEYIIHYSLKGNLLNSHLPAVQHKKAFVHLTRDHRRTRKSNHKTERGKSVAVSQKRFHSWVMTDSFRRSEPSMASSKVMVPAQ